MTPPDLSKLPTFEFTLIKNHRLNHDMYELTFEADRDFDMIPGEHFGFHLPILDTRRPFTPISKSGKVVTFAIRRLENGRGGTKEICDAEVGSTFQVIGPVGALVDSKKSAKKLYIATGTGMAPLYDIICNLLNNQKSQDTLHLVWGNRTYEDIFYKDKLDALVQTHPNFSVTYALSQEQKDGYIYGHVQSYLSEDVVHQFDEFYVCGKHAIEDDIQKHLEQLGVHSDQIIREG